MNIKKIVFFGYIFCILNLSPTLLDAKEQSHRQHSSIKPMSKENKSSNDNSFVPKTRMDEGLIKKFEEDVQSVFKKPTKDMFEKHNPLVEKAVESFKKIRNAMKHHAITKEQSLKIRKNHLDQ